MYKRNEKSFFKHLDFFILDSIMMQIAFCLSYILRHGFHNPYESESYRQMAIVMGIFMICVAFMSSGYENILKRGYLQELKQCVKMISVLSLLLIAYMFVIQTSTIYSRYVMLMCWAIGLYLVYMEHIIWKSVLVSRMERSKGKRQIMLMTSTVEMAQEVMSDFQQQQFCDFVVTCVVLLETGDAPREVCGVPVLMGAETALTYASNSVIDEVLAYTTLDLDVPEWFIEDCLNMGIVVHQNLKERLPYDVRQEISKLGKYIVLTASVNSATVRQLFFKRLLDICGALVGLVFTGLAFLFVAPIIKIQSPGPVIFKQKRMGKNGRQFYIYKFRSMYMDAEERKAELMEQNKMKGPISKFENDPRIFPFGKFIRRTSIDELPQFWNVLKGDMSLVGTRPPTVDEYEQYELRHKKRLAAKPGLTGMWQVSGRSDMEDFEEIIRLDSQYISNWTLAMDIKILLRTVVAVFRKKGAE